MVIDFQLGEFDITPENRCLSGGCKGADQVFGEQAEKAGHAVDHFSFQGHSWDKKCNPKTIRVLNELALSEANVPLKQAAAFLGRTTGGYQYVRDLLRRNFWQIKTTQRVYAVTPIDWSDGRPKGGTGWAITMALFRDVPEIYCFDVTKLKWYKVLDWDQMGKTVTWGVTKPLRPYGSYTGIGSHDLTIEGRDAIMELYNEG